MSGDDWFPDWVDVHCRATGADARTRDALLANRVNFVDRWGSTPAELGECTVRLVGRGRTPKFASEHADAVGRELNELRSGRAAATRAAPPGDFAPDCDACGGSGLAAVPHPRCVWERRVVLHPAQGRVVTVAVLCDRPGCEAGRVARDRESSRRDDRPRRPTLGAYSRVLGCDAAGLQRWYERELARRARSGGGENPLSGVLASILAKLGADAA